MRTPDKIGGPSQVDEHGGHIAATLARLIENEETKGAILAEVTNSLASLVEDVEALEIARDEARQQLIVTVRMKGCTHLLGPRALSDGTLRFLTLAVMATDRQSAAVLCLEEPENGMHPFRVASIVNLLRELVVSAEDEVGSENPLRQVILNTHSPDVVKQLYSHEVLFVENVNADYGTFARVCAIEGEWRATGPKLPKRRLWDFIGGAPLGEGMLQLELDMKNGKRNP